MAIVFPLSREAFLDRLPVHSVRFDPPAQNTTNNTAGGEILRAQVAPKLWEGYVAFYDMAERDADELRVLLSMLEDPGREFFAYQKNKIGPASDPMGTALSGASVQIKAIDEAESTLELEGLPAGFELAAGDFLSFTYGTPNRYALHWIGEAVTANGAGETAAFKVTPHLRGGATVGRAVELVKPYCKAVIVPQTVDFGETSKGTVFGMGFRLRQTLRTD